MATFNTTVCWNTWNEPMTAVTRVTFSEDRMEEASVVRGRFQRFLALADAASLGGKKGRDPLRRWGEREKRLAAETSTCRR